MSDQEKMMAIAAITGETDDDTLSLYLQTAGEAILERAYPFRSDITEVPAKLIDGLIQKRSSCKVRKTPDRDCRVSDQQARGRG